jgi:diguanylate cyclase (GGDEF)-like protein
VVARISPLHVFAQTVANAVMTIGALVFAGWLFGFEPLKRVLPGLVAMKVNAALCFVLAGLSLRLLAREPAGEAAPDTSGRPDRRAWPGTAVGVAGAAVVALIGLLTLCEYRLGRDLGLDQLVLREEAGAIGTAAPGRMAPATALNFLLLGGALLLLHGDRPHRRWLGGLAHALAALAGLIGLLAAIGYAYRLPALYALPGTTQMSVHAALTFTLLAAGVVVARPGSGLSASVTGDSVGGVLARRVLPAAIGLPLALGWLTLAGARAGLYSHETGFALAVLSTVAIFAAVLWLAARSLPWAHALRVPAGDGTGPALAAPRPAPAQNHRNHRDGPGTVLLTGEDLAGWVEQLEHFAHEMRLVAELDERLQAGLSDEEAYAVVERSAPRLFPALAGALYVRRGDEPRFEAVATWGDVAGAESLFIPADCWALRRGRLHPPPAYRAGLVCRHLGRPLPPDALCAPLLAHGEPIGVLTVRATSPDRPLTEAQEQLAATVAEHVALALTNLREREALRGQAIRDPLTGLFNRRYLEETLQRELSRAVRHGSALGVIMLDLDHFKRLNDAFGHLAGDALLRALGAFLVANLRREDVACRYGGEEFLLILPGSTLENARRRAEQLQEQLKDLRAEHDGRPLGPVTCSLGVAAYPEHGATAEALVQAADTALYRAKLGGRDRVAVAGD